MIQELNSQIKKELEDISRKYSLKLLILFGSRSNNKHKEMSDWDFAFYPSSNFTIDNEMSLFNDLMELLKYEKIDLINLKTTKKLHVANNIFQTGVVIYEKEKGFFTQKKWDAWQDLQDFKRYHSWQVELTKSNLKKMIENG